ncbi:MAG: DUF192 domain-containing protein [Leptolyngbyaceae cyanobacterium bins.302]|nr:DUF192 domain-containing protein [Leptolyngbyaceae cyanobacterium bins.302]
MKKFVRDQERSLRQRHYAGVGVVVGLSMLILSCASSTPETPPETNSGQVVQISNSGQSLPVSAKVNLGGQVIQLEVAKTPEQQAMGLMFRSELEPNRGMLFPFNPPRPVTFWMKNVLIDLDMVFLRNGKVVAIASNVPPCKADPCPVYGPATAVIDQVIELRGGRAKELGIKAGDRLTIQSVN